MKKFVRNHILSKHFLLRTSKYETSECFGFYICRGLNYSELFTDISAKVIFVTNNIIEVLIFLSCMSQITTLTFMICRICVSDILSVGP